MDDTPAFDRGYWEQHWSGRIGGQPPNPYLASELIDVTPGRALDAGCGLGSEAIWLAAVGWSVVAADISATALEAARQRAVQSVDAGEIEWVEADLSVWEPERQFNLVTTHYAHPSIPQLDFYQRIADWVAPEGTLLIVGHGHGHAEGHGHAPNETHEHTRVDAAAVAGLFPAAEWQVESAHEPTRVVSRNGHDMRLDDVVVRVRRRG